MVSLNQPEHTAEWYLARKSELMWMLIFLGIVLGVIILLWIISLIAFCREKNQIKSNQFLKILTMVCLTISILVAITSFVTVQLSIIDGKFGSNTVEDLIGIGILSYGIQCSIVLIIFGLRIIKAFKNTPHAMGKLFKRWLFVLITIITVSFLVAVTQFVFSRNQEVRFMLGGAATMFATVNGVILLVIFVKKLNKVIGDFLLQFGAVSGETMIELNIQVSAALETEDNEVDFKADGNNNDNSDNKKGLDENMVLLNNIIAEMIKYTILIGVAMTSTTIVSLSVPVTISSNSVPIVYIAFFATNDGLINGICLLLQFKVARKFYKCLCKICIKKCQERQTIQINKNIKTLEKVVSVELKVLPSGGIGIETIDNNDVNDNDINDINDNDVNTSENNNPNQPAITTLKSVEMQLN